MKTRSFQRLPALILIVPLLSALLTGCWDRRELNELAVGIGMGIDKEQNQFKVSVQVVIPSEIAAKQSSSGGAPVTLFEATAPTIFEALRKMTVRSPRRVYLAHLQVLILGEELAKEGIEEVLDFFKRESKVREDFLVMVSKDAKAWETLEIITSLERIPGEKLRHSLDVSSRYFSPTSTVSILELIDNIVGEGVEPVLTGIIIEGNKQQGSEISNAQRIKPRAILELHNLAVFRQGKLLGWLNEDESKGYNYVQNKIHSSVGHVELEGSRITIEAIDSKTAIHVKMVRNKPVIQIDIRNTSNLIDVESGLNITDPKVIREIESAAEARIIQLVNEVVRSEKEVWKSDFLGFGRHIHDAYPHEWKTLRNDWNSKLSMLDVECKAKVKISLIGKSGKSIKETIEEK